MGEYMDLITGDNGAVAPSAPESAPKPPEGWYNFLTSEKLDFDAPKIKSDSERGASVIDIGVASLANDPKAQIRYFAKQRGIPESRYKVTDRGIAYQADDGNFYLEIPEPSLRDPKTLAQGFATGVGAAFPVVPSTIVGTVTAPAMVAGPVGAVASTTATAAAGAAGQGVREGLANWLMDQEVSPTRIGLEGMSAATGQAIGGGLTKFSQRGLARDINRLDPRAVDDVAGAARREGISLTPAEKTGLPSLGAQQKSLGNLPQSADKMGKFYKGRDRQVRDAVQRFLDRISPIDSAEVAGETARSTAKSAMRQLAKNRADQARPFYEKAFAQNPEVPVGTVIDSIDVQLQTAKGGIKTALERAKALLYQTVETTDEAGNKILANMPESRLDALHQVKLALDDMIGNHADTSIGRTARGKLIEIKNDLLAEIDAVSPDYQAARAIFADLSPQTVRVAEGIVGKVSKLSESTMKDAARVFFGPSSGPRAIAEAKSLMVRQNPEAWQGVKRSYLQDIFEKAQNETVQGTANVAGKYRQAIMGNTQQRARLKAALEPNEWRALKDLTLVLERASTVKQIGSDTAWNQEAMRLARDNARPWFSKIIRNLNPAQALRSFDEWTTERNLAKNADRLADVITSPDAMKLMKEIKRLPPGSIRARILTGHLLMIGGREVASVGPRDLGQIQ
ncbi:MAG: hypothetical protein ACPG4X_14730 [Pikeienuella sp.]